MLADRVGIIDHGRIVAEGTPEELKAQIGRPSVEAVPADARRPRGGRRRARALRRARRGPPGAAAVRLERRRGPRRRGPRARTPRACSVADLQLHQPSLDDVFLAKTAASSRRGEEEDTGAMQQVGGVSLLAQSGEMARRSVLQTLRQPAMVVPPIAVPAHPDGRQRRRPAGRDEPARLSDRRLPQLRDRVPVHPGLTLRVDQRRLEPGAGRRDRVHQAAGAHADAARRDAARAARRAS